MNAITKLGELVEVNIRNHEQKALMIWLFSALTCVAVPADDLGLALLSDVENPISVCSDGDVGAACGDVAGGFVAGVVFQTPPMDGGGGRRG